MDIKESINMNTSITVKDANGVDTPVAYLSSNVDSGNQNMNISVNIQNRSLLTETAVNVVGQTPAQQYAEFETRVKAKAQDLGFVMFVAQSAPETNESTETPETSENTGTETTPIDNGTTNSDNSTTTTDSTETSANTEEDAKNESKTE